jgi:hypothetical protein
MADHMGRWSRISSDGLNTLARLGVVLTDVNVNTKPPISHHNQTRREPLSWSHQVPDSWPAQIRRQGMTCTLRTSSFKRSLTWGVSLLLGVASWSLAARTVSPLPADLADLTRYRNFVGTPLYFQVTAPTSGSGSLWGTQIYSDDSSLAKAALHAGVLQAGQTGVLKVIPLGPQSSFTGSTAYGVTSSGAGSYSGSYKIEADDGGNNPVLPDPVNLLGYRNAIGGCICFLSKALPFTPFGAAIPTATIAH